MVCAVQSGPLPVPCKLGYISTCRGYNRYNPTCQFFIRPFTGVITLLVTSRGPPCKSYHIIYHSPWVFAPESSRTPHSLPAFPRRQFDGVPAPCWLVSIGTPVDCDDSFGQEDSITWNYPPPPRLSPPGLLHLQGIANQTFTCHWVASRSKV